jgi:hypothetical protein
MPAAGAVVMPASCAALFPCEPEQAVSTPNTAIPAIAMDNQLRGDLLETRFMIIYLAIGCEPRPFPQHSARDEPFVATRSEALAFRRPQFVGFWTCR